ncbi:phosphate signaling complex protein PhoU [Entomomonas sp. E2T0]|uniref:phosphate signaling complex protein PhoU n=1 Tax=Entomomonas sp. E2T0 TaxID=2930213 RepID=UPI00222823C5|nr:phosphate signaling complex protein PhoU [Entomomonas sp. E2T0]UYZ83218.1 phosphate signaling complex protein PhoU [Entomomonas sp. E2T0]
MTNKHLSTQFDAELNSISTQIMELGGLVESQMTLAITALTSFDIEVSDKVIELEHKVNSMEVEIDKNLVSMIARRQPTARDLRLLMAISKTTNNLERAGDEATKIARMVKSIIEHGISRNLMGAELRFMANLALDLLHKSLDAFARLDIKTALYIMRSDNEIDVEFGGFTRKLITYMMEDPRMISPSLDLLFIAKALERIGDHAKNIAELIIYIVKGEDVRHVAMEEIESITNNSEG